MNNIANKKFGRLTAIQINGMTSSKNLKWLCKCDCGNEITVVGSDLKIGHTRSCGCLKNEGNNLQHGQGKKGQQSPTYMSWAAMMNRCYNKNYTRYYDYGGRGIKVCKRWHKFVNFLDDMGERPPGTSIDKFPDNNGNYKKSNCRWATPIQQSNNRRERTKKLAA